MGEKVELVDAVIRAATEVDGRKKLPCAAVFRLAERYGAKVLEIGQICNANDIRIINCQLGCFE